jgi:hypothetical protein
MGMVFVGFPGGVALGVRFSTFFDAMSAYALTFHDRRRADVGVAVGPERTRRIAGL